MKRTILALLLAMGLVFGVAYAAEDEMSEWEKNYQIEQLELEKQRMAFEREKWEHEVAEAKRKEYESEFSNLMDIKRDIPVFQIYSIISDTDRRNLRKDFSILYESGVRHVIVNVSSYGGEAMGGLGIADTIMEFRQKGMKVEGRAYGKVCSAAVPIFAVCSPKTTGPSTMFMVHEASIFKFWTSETHSDIRSQKEMLDQLQAKYIAILVEHSDMDYDFWLGLEGRTTWFTSDQALEWGLVDKIE